MKNATSTALFAAVLRLSSGLLFLLAAPTASMSAIDGGPDDFTGILAAVYDLTVPAGSGLRRSTRLLLIVTLAVLPAGASLSSSRSNRARPRFSERRP